VRQLLAYAILVLCLAPVVLYGQEISVKEVSFVTAERNVLTRLFASPNDGPHPAIVLLHGRSGYLAQHRLYDGWIVMVRETIGYVAQQPTTDAHRIGLLGFSNGGFIAVGAAGFDSRIGAVVEVYGGMPSALRDRVERLPPTLILHGDADTALRVDEAYALARFLQQRAIAHAIQIYPGGPHGFDADPTSSYARDAQERTLDFFNTRVVGCWHRSMNTFDC
jgi:fermentation-respiration switch protein FrsA (DUF1100 family)